MGNADTWLDKWIFKHILTWDVLICTYIHVHNLCFRRCILPGRSVAGGHRNCRGRRTSADDVFFLKVTTVCLAEVVVCVASFTFSDLIRWVDPVYLQHMAISKICGLQAKRKDMETSSRLWIHQGQLVGLQIQPTAGDGIVGGNKKGAVAQRFG